MHHAQHGGWWRIIKCENKILNPEVWWWKWWYIKHQVSLSHFYEWINLSQKNIPLCFRENFKFLFGTKNWNWNSNSFNAFYVYWVCCTSEMYRGVPSNVQYSLAEWINNDKYRTSRRASVVLQRVCSSQDWNDATVIKSFSS